MLELIDEQAAAGPAGRIVLKVNGLTDPEMIDALYARVVCRGADRPGRARPVLPAAGHPGAVGDHPVRSIVGQFLEHSRIYRFGGSKDDAPHVAGSDSARSR